MPPPPPRPPARRSMRQRAPPARDLTAGARPRASGSGRGAAGRRVAPTPEPVPRVPFASARAVPGSGASTRRAPRPGSSPRVDERQAGAPAWPEPPPASSAHRRRARSGDQWPRPAHARTHRLRSWLGNPRRLGGWRDHDRRGRWRRRGHGPRHRIRRRRLCGHGWLRGRRQEEQRIEVALSVDRHTNAEVNVRHGMFRHSAGAHGAHGVALRDRVAPLHGERPEVQQRHRVPVRGFDRKRAAAGRNGSGEGDDAARRRRDVSVRRRPDVDAAMQTTRIRVGVEAERLQHRPLDGPCPSARSRGRDQRSNRGTHGEPQEKQTDLLPVLQTDSTLAGDRSRCQI
jgi:hypothetical protein